VSRLHALTDPFAQPTKVISYVYQLKNGEVAVEKIEYSKAQAE
jgi:hypothetical protein